MDGPSTQIPLISIKDQQRLEKKVPTVSIEPAQGSHLHTPIGVGGIAFHVHVAILISQVIFINKCLSHSTVASPNWRRSVALALTTRSSGCEMSVPLESRR